MAIIESVSVRNLRSLRDVSSLRLKPINILVGRNSSGKSTYARILPLLKQTVMGNSKEPLLWWGNNVDFGSYKESLGEYRDKEGVLVKADHIEIGVTYSVRPIDDGGLEEVDYRLRVSERDVDESAYVSWVSAKFKNVNFEITIRPDNKVNEIVINGKSHYVDGKYPGVHLLNDSSTIVPEINAYKSGGKKRPLSKMHNFLGLVVGSDDSDLSVFNYVLEFSYGEYFLNGAKELKSFLKRFNGDIYEKNFASLKELDLNFILIPSLMKKVSAHIETAILDVSYMEPLRAIANRYYRKQNVRPEIDGKGENVAMFFSSITESSRARFNSWLSKHFGFTIVTQDFGEHVSVCIKMDDSGHKRNIADMGFGYSQLLPILVQLWAVGQHSGSLKRDMPKTSGRTLVIEQPELHLHPAYQSKVADILSGFVAEFNEKNDIRIIVETHSPNIVNRLGELVSEGIISSSDVQVILFDACPKRLSTEISISEFDSSGVLTNWPFGFFEPEIQ